MPKTADRPHLVTIIISSLALIISLVSLNETRQSRKLSEATSQAVLQTSELSLLSKWAWHKGEAKPSDMPVKITLHNAGRASAKNIIIEVDLGLVFQVPSADHQISRRTFSELGYTKLLPEDVGPGVIANYRLSISMDNLMKAIKILPDGPITGLFLTPNLQYEDGATGTAMAETPCFLLGTAQKNVFAPGLFSRCPVIATGTVRLP